MTLWWIGNALLVVVLVVVIALLSRLLAAVERIRGAADDILTHGVELLGEVDAVGPVLGLADDLEPGVLERPPQPLPDEPVVVDQQHPLRHVVALRPVAVQQVTGCRAR